MDADVNYVQFPNLTQSTNKIRTMASAKKIVDIYKVLIVGDTIFNVDVFKVILKKTLNCSTEVAFNGLEAVNLVKTGVKFDLIFMDISMPLMNGH